MNILVLGAGNIGTVVLHDLSQYMSVGKLVVADRDPDRISAGIAVAGGNAEGICIDAGKYNDLVDTIRHYDLVVNALPGRYGFKVVKAAIESKVDVVDVSYMPEDIFILDDDASKAGVRVVPDAGVAPGLSNILVGHAVGMLDAVDTINIYVGGLPTGPMPPLDYVVTWSVEDLIDEYTRRPRIVVDGKIVEVDVLTGLEESVFPGVGVLEAFYTDGLRTLLHTMRDVDTMWEKTLRYPGHLEKIKLLKDLGLFSDEPILGVSPREVLIKLLEERLRKPDIEDLLVLKIYVAGYKDGGRLAHTYYLLEKGFDIYGFSAMARVTGYIASAIAQLIIDDYIGLDGIVPPEVIGMDRKLYRLIMDKLNSKGIYIEENLVKDDD